MDWSISHPSNSKINSHKNYEPSCRLCHSEKDLFCRPLNYFASLYRRVQKNMMNMDQMLNMLEIESCVQVCSLKPASPYIMQALSNAISDGG